MSSAAMHDCSFQALERCLTLDELQELDIHIREVREMLCAVKKPKPVELQSFESDLQAVSTKLQSGLATEEVYSLLSKIEALVEDSVWEGMVRVQPTPGAASKVRDVMELIDRLGYYQNFRYRNPEVRKDTKDGESHVLLQWREANRETITSARVTHCRRIRGFRVPIVHLTTSEYVHQSLPEVSEIRSRRIQA